MLETKLIKEINKHLGIQCPPLHRNIEERTVTCKSGAGIYFSKSANQQGCEQEYCHEVWHWIHKDYAQYDDATYPKHADNSYKFGINLDWDFREGRAVAKSRELFALFNIPSNIENYPDYVEAEKFYNKNKELNMIKVNTIDKIAKVGLSQMDGKYDIGEHADPQAILLRSTKIHDMQFGKSLLAIARAGAGVNNIPIDKCTEQGIVVFNTPGANALAVAELIIAGLLLSSRKVVDGIAWAQTLKGDDVAAQVEKGKSAFVGPEIAGKKLGVIGLGAIGVLVANMATKLGMEVIGFDPNISVDSAQKLSHKVTRIASINEIYTACDYISLNVPANEKTKGMINNDVLASLKKGVRLLNFSRAELVDNKAILKATEDGTVSCYVTDFPTEPMLRNKNIIPIPHLGASTPESEDNCARMAVKQVMDYIEFGSIVNSVNLPACSLGKPAATRVCVIHKNDPDTVAQISKIFAEAKTNIDASSTKSRDAIAYTVIDAAEISDDIVKKVQGVSGVVSVRLIV